MQRLVKGRTVLVIAHRLSTIQARGAAVVVGGPLPGVGWPWMGGGEQACPQLRSCTDVHAPAVCLLALAAALPSCAGAGSFARPLCLHLLLWAKPSVLHRAHPRGLTNPPPALIDPPRTLTGPPRTLTYPKPTPQSANQIVVMAGGKVVEVGTHEELSATSQHYEELMKAQELMLAST